MHRKGFVALFLSALVAGCLSPEAKLKGLREDNPRFQTAMIARVVRDGDQSMAGELIDLLESKDEGVRFMAATGLHKLTGTDRGFHFARGDGRKRIIAEWRRWWEVTNRPPAGTKPDEKAGPTGGAADKTGKESGP